jgi:cytochrome b561
MRGIYGFRAPSNARDGRMLKNTTQSWGAVARAFHWILGTLILGMIAYGWWMNHIPARPDRFFYRSIHADIGYVVLLLLVLRLLWRVFNPTPALPADTARWERWLARANQGALYLATFIVAMLGWAHSGANARPYTSWFGLFDVPQFTSTDKAAAHLYEDYHIYGAYVLLALIVLHVVAVLYRHFYKRDRVLQRMVSGESI